MANYNNGHVVDVKKMNVRDYEIAAKEWAEGSKALEELLLYCLKNNIVTQACCAGHKDTDRPFLQFELSENNINAIIKIINRYYNLNGVNMHFFNQPGFNSKFDINIPKNISEQFFQDMLVQLSNGLDIQMDSLSPDMQKSLNVMLNNKVPNDYLEVQYSMEDNQKKLFVATTNPDYSDLYWDNKNAKPWVDGSTSIEDSPDKIIPILDDISKKEPIEYSNYLERQERTGIVSTDWEKLSTIVLNVQATRKDDKAREQGYQIVEVLPGMAIEKVAEEVCGKKYRCNFNNFEIDGMQYDSPEQIVAAYQNSWKKGKEEFLAAKQEQKKLDSQIRDQQVEEVINSMKLKGGVIKK